MSASAEEIVDYHTTAHELVKYYQRTLETGVIKWVTLDRWNDKGVLRDEQKQGLVWLAAMFEAGLNPILSDDMGFGKTRQVAMFMFYLHKRYPEFRKFLVVCPLSVKAIWDKEIITIDKSDAFRNMIKITTYEDMISDVVTQGTTWDYVVFDEAHRLRREEDGEQTQTRAIAAYLSTPRFVLVTGTPYVQAPVDVYKLLSFANPKLFNPSVSAAITADEVALHIKPFILRRTPDLKRKLIEKMHRSIAKDHTIRIPYIIKILKQKPTAKTVIFSSRIDPVCAHARLSLCFMHTHPPLAFSYLAVWSRVCS